MVADQLVTSTSLTTAIVGSNGSARNAHLRATVGAQYEVSPAVRLGVVLRSRRDDAARTALRIQGRRGVVNLAIGGRYLLKQNGAVTLHAGYATDRSPVGEDDTAFTKVHLQNLTAGVSARTKWLLGSFGVHYASGQSDPLVLRPGANGTTFDTSFKVSNVGLVYSLAVLF
jgi:hypothetical protein